jgi:glycogen(starch) synthase
MQKGCVVATAWGSDVVQPPGEEEPTQALRDARTALIRNAATVTACGPTFAGIVAKFAGVPAGSVEIVPFGVDLSIFHAPPDASRPHRVTAEHGPPFRVGFFKGFREVYGPTTWIRAMPIVLQEFPDTRFDMVGDGPQLESCRSLAEELNVSHAIQWIPRTLHNQIPKLISAWDLSVIPSEFEAFGVAALESSAMGVPVVAADVGGLRDTVIDGRTGLLVPPRSPDALARAVVRLLHDVGLRRNLGRAGVALVTENFAWDHVITRWERTYENALDRVCAMA